MTRPIVLQLVAAAGLGLSFGAPAQTLQIRGLVDLSAGRFQDAGASASRDVRSGSMTTSFLGVNGTDDLGGGLKAKFVFEHFLRPDSGQAGRYDGDAFWARDAYVALSGGFGTTRLGRNTTPLFVSTLRFNAFGDSFGFSPSIRQLFTPALLPFFGDTAWSNSISYSANEEEGLSHSLIANLSESAPGATGKNFGANVMYDKGPLAATVAWQRVRNGDGISPASAFTTAPAGFAKQETWQFGVSYDLAVVKLYGQYAHVRTGAASGTRTELWGIGAAVPWGAGTLLAQYGHARARVAGAEPTNSTLSLGYDHALSKLTDVYAVFMNDRVSDLPSGSTLAAGMRLRF